MLEHSGTATRPYSCYSTVDTYGADGKFRPIVMPTAAALTPTLFQNFKRPPPLPQPHLPTNHSHSCSGYSYLEKCNKSDSEPYVKYRY